MSNVDISYSHALLRDAVARFVKRGGDLTHGEECAHRNCGNADDCPDAAGDCEALQERCTCVVADVHALRTALVRAKWGRVYDVLVQEAKAAEDYRERFLDYMTEELPSRGRTNGEWRFMGCLGFGGKLYWDGRRASINKYPEDRSDEDVVLIKRVNDMLRAIIASEEAPCT